MIKDFSTLDHSKHKKWWHTKAFCLGETLQHMTESHLTASLRSWSFMSLFKAISRAFPSTINAKGRSFVSSLMTMWLYLSIWPNISSLMTWKTRQKVDYLNTNSILLHMILFSTRIKWYLFSPLWDFSTQLLCLESNELASCPAEVNCKHICKIWEEVDLAIGWPFFVLHLDSLNISKAAYFCHLKKKSSHPMFTAVSVLSPVSSQIFNPACASLSMHSGTWKKSGRIVSILQNKFTLQEMHNVYVLFNAAY